MGARRKAAGPPPGCAHNPKKLRALGPTNLELGGNQGVVRRTQTTAPPFRFLHLPSELRVLVYHYILPRNLRIEFAKNLGHVGRKQSTHNKPNLHALGWAAWAHDKGEQNHGAAKRLSAWKIELSIFLTNKLISNEALAVLYGDNIFAFHIDGDKHQPKSMKSPEIFGPFGEIDRLPLLRNIRSLEINVDVSQINHWTTKRHRARLEYFIGVLKQHSDDENQKSLLKHLKVVFNMTINGPVVRDASMFIYGLESLAALRGIERVEITGPGLPKWYAECLELCIQGIGGDVLPIDYPEVLVEKKKQGKKRKKQSWMTTKLWHQPFLDWEEFAKRNKIEIPEGINPLELSSDGGWI